MDALLETSTTQGEASERHRGKITLMAMLKSYYPTPGDVPPPEDERQ